MKRQTSGRSLPISVAVDRRFYLSGIDLRLL